MLKRSIIWIIILGAGIGTLYAFESTRVPCQQALAYSVGQFDPRFGITEDEFRQAIASAEQPWEEALGRDLFRYEAGALFPVNLIFDERQARTIDGQALDHEWAAVQSQQTTIKGKYDAFSAELAKARQKYDASAATFDTRLGRYNDRVDAWNRGARTDQDELEGIQSEEKRLRQDQAALEKERDRVNALVTEVNRYAKEGEKVVDRYNERVNDFTATYGTEGSFDQGVYEGTGIDIYQFDDREHLRMVLIHELGHALGIAHVVNNPASIMYPVMGAQDVKHLTLTTEDRAALDGVCSVTAWDLLLRDSREAWSLMAT